MQGALPVVAPELACVVGLLSTLGLRSQGCDLLLLHMIPYAESYSLLLFRIKWLKLKFVP